MWFSPFPVPCRCILLCSPATAVLHPPPNSNLSLFSSRSTSHHACLLSSQLILIVQSAGPTVVDSGRNGSRLPPLSEKERVEKSQWLRVHHPPVPSGSPPSHGDTRPFMFRKSNNNTNSQMHCPSHFRTACWSRPRSIFIRRVLHRPVLSSCPCSIGVNSSNSSSGEPRLPFVKIFLHLRF